MLKGKNIDENSTDESSKPNLNVVSELKKTKILDSALGRNKLNSNRTVLGPNFFDAKR